MKRKNEHLFHYLQIGYLGAFCILINRPQRLGQLHCGKGLGTDFTQVPLPTGEGLRVVVGEDVRP